MVARNFEKSSNFDEPVNFSNVLRKLDQQFSGLAPSIVEKFQFDLFGQTYSVRRISTQGGFHFLISVDLGYLPFSIESSERRNAIKSIVMATQALPNVRFAIDPASKISAGALFEPMETIAPDFIFYPLMLFFQEARPFMELIGTYLFEPLAEPGPSANTEETIKF